MTDNVLKNLTEKLANRLNLDGTDEETMELLEDELLDAETEILLELNLNELEEWMYSKVIELAAVYYKFDISETYKVNATDYRKEVQDIFKSLRGCSKFY